MPHNAFVTEDIPINTKRVNDYFNTIQLLKIYCIITPKLVKRSEFSTFADILDRYWNIVKTLHQTKIKMLY